MASKSIGKQFKFIYSILILICVNICFVPFLTPLITIPLFLILLSIIWGILYKISGQMADFQKNNNKRIVNLEMACYTSEALLEQLISAGNALISEMERDALLKRIRDSFAAVTKASAGYLMMYNQHLNLYEWGIGHNLSQLKLKATSLPATDVLMGKVLANNSAVIFHEMGALQSSNLLHVRDDILPSLVPKPEILLTIRLKMKSSMLGVQFLLISRMQAEYIEKNMTVFNSLVNLTTLALGTAVQREFAINDRMTMLYNHEYFVSRLREEIAMCERSKGRALTLLMTDIDHFKKFNDTYGHQIGDFVLIEVAKIYRDSVRISDIVARYGGEEFAIIFPQTNLKDGVKIAEKIRMAVENHVFKCEKGDLHVTVSIGVCEWLPDAEPALTVESMVKRSDLKLYECKEKGRNRVCF